MGVPIGAEGGIRPPGEQIFLKKRSIFEKIWYFWVKNWVLPPLKIFLNFAPL